MNLDELQQVASQFALYTDALLVAAEQGQWEEFLLVFDARQQQMEIMEREAGDRLLIVLPELHDCLASALDKNRRIELLTAARRDELGAELASVQQQRRLNMAYR